MNNETNANEVTVEETKAHEVIAPVVTEVKAPEAVVEEKKEPEVKVQAAPRHKVEKINIKKKTFKELQYEKEIASVKLWSQAILENQIKSERTPEDFKKACEAELKARKELREKKK